MFPDFGGLIKVLFVASALGSVAILAWLISAAFWALRHLYLVIR